MNASCLFQFRHISVPFSVQFATKNGIVLEYSSAAGRKLEGT